MISNPPVSRPLVLYCLVCSMDVSFLQFIHGLGEPREDERGYRVYGPEGKSLRELLTEHEARS
jgi:hypothetical protein